MTFSPVDIEARKALQFGSGDTVRVWSKIEDKGKYRLQAFEGIVLARQHGTSPSATFTVRRVSNGIGVERVFHSFLQWLIKLKSLRNQKPAEANFITLETRRLKKFEER